MEFLQRTTSVAVTFLPHLSHSCSSISGKMRRRSSGVQGYYDCTPVKTLGKSALLRQPQRHLITVREDPCSSNRHPSNSTHHRQQGFTHQTWIIFLYEAGAGKSWEPNQDLYKVFVNLTKAFDSVGRQSLWKILGKVGNPSKIINIIRSFHDGIVDHVIDKGTISNPFPANSRTKQSCIMALLLFSIPSLLSNASWHLQVLQQGCKDLVPHRWQSIQHPQINGQDKDDIYAVAWPPPQWRLCPHCQLQRRGTEYCQRPHQTRHPLWTDH